MSEFDINIPTTTFAKLFDDAYAVSCEDGGLYDVFCDYELEDGTLCTAFVSTISGCSDTEYIIKPEWETGPIVYNTQSHTFKFDSPDCDVPPFKILTVATI